MSNRRQLWLPREPFHPWAYGPPPDPPDVQTSDRFNRPANASSLGSTTTGQAYTAHSGTWGVNGHGAYLVTQSGDSVATFDCGFADQDLSVDLIFGDDDDIGIVCRTIDHNNYWLVQIYSGELYLWSRTSGSYSNVAGPYALPGGKVAGTAHNVRITTFGTRFDVYYDGLPAIVNYTSATRQTATRVGFRMNNAASIGGMWTQVLCRPYGVAPARRMAEWGGHSFLPGVLPPDTGSPRRFKGWANPAKEGAAVVEGDTWEQGVYRPNRLPVIFDSDMNTDPDDAFDLAALLQYHNAGAVQLLGLVGGSASDTAPGVMRVLDTYYANGNIEVCSLRDLAPGFQDITEDWFVDTFNAFPRPGVGLVSDGGMLTSTQGYRKWLAQSTGGVHIIGTGFAKAIRLAMESSADGYSSLNGLDLFTAKVERIWMVAGEYPSGAEYNMQQNPADFAWLADNSPVPITWALPNFSIGNAGGAYFNARQDITNPIRYMIDNSPYIGVGRPQFSMPCIFTAVEGVDRFRGQLITGTNVINPTTGANVFTDGAGPHQRLAAYSSARIPHLVNVGNSIIAADAKQGFKTWRRGAWV